MAEAAEPENHPSDPPGEAGASVAPAAPFWRTIPLKDMDQAQWESLCDGCARCCLIKLEVEDDPRARPAAPSRHLFTDIACRLLDARACRCRDYANRQASVPDCVRLTPELVDAASPARLSWLPPTCAYRLVGEGKDLPWWHPLVSGDPETVVLAGVSARGRIACSEDDIPLELYPERVRAWPNRWPRKARRKMKII